MVLVRSLIVSLDAKLPKVAVHWIERRNQACRRHGLVDRIETEHIDILSNSIQLTGIVYWPGLLAPISLYRATSIGLSALVLCKPTLHR